MKRVLFFIVSLFFTAILGFSQNTVKSFNITLIQGNFDKYGFSKEYQYANFKFEKDTFYIRYAKGGVDTIFKVSYLKKDSALLFIQQLTSYKNISDYSDNSKPDSTIPDNKLYIRLNNKLKIYTYTTPFNSNTELGRLTNWLITYAAVRCNKNSKATFAEYLINKTDTIQTGHLLSEIVSRFSYPNQKKTIEYLKKTNDWNIILGVYKAFCYNVTKLSKETIGSKFDLYINDSLKAEEYVDLLICQNNDDYIKDLLLKATKSNNIHIKEKAFLYLAEQGVTDVRPLVVEYIKKTLNDNTKLIHANSYFRITSRIYDTKMLKEMIELYKQNKNVHSIAIKELMHAIECNIECYRNIHNEYTFEELVFDFEKAQNRLDLKIANFLSSVN